jgi:nitrite reductase/ring-hydroxylating ferredoxin subunit
MRITTKEIKLSTRAHAGAPLVEGSIEDDILTCPWHGSRFRVTNGEVVKGPAEKGLRVYKTTIKNGFLYVDFE